MPSKKTDDQGDFTVGTLQEVGQFFDVSPNTVRTSWRPCGMPGPDKDGRWNIAWIAQWQMRRLENNALRRRAGLRDGESI